MNTKILICMENMYFFCFFLLYYSRGARRMDGAMEEVVKVNMYNMVGKMGLLFFHSDVCC